MARRLVLLLAVWAAAGVSVDLAWAATGRPVAAGIGVKPDFDGDGYAEVS